VNRREKLKGKSQKAKVKGERGYLKMRSAFSKQPSAERIIKSGS
jgi:hypothetical protein